jgi:ATP-dependent DNA helicase 2 subunit 2
MADKEATVYIVDVGQSMGERNGGRDTSDLDWSMNYVWDKIATTVRGLYSVPPPWPTLIHIY